MRSRAVLMAITLFTLIVSSVWAQGAAEVMVEWSDAETLSSYSKGEQELSFYNWKFENVLKEISRDVIFTIESEALRTKTVNLKYSGDLSNPQWVIDNINTALSSQGIEIAESKDIPDTYSLSYKKQEGCRDSPYLNQVTSINRVWRGQCVQLSKVAEKIADWFDLYIEIEEDLIIPEVTLHHDEYQIFILYLEQEGFELGLNTELSTGKTNYIYK